MPCFLTRKTANDFLAVLVLSIVRIQYLVQISGTFWRFSIIVCTLMNLNGYVHSYQFHGALFCLSHINHFPLLLLKLHTSYFTAITFGTWISIIDAKNILKEEHIFDLFLFIVYLVFFFSIYQDCRKRKRCKICKLFVLNRITFALGHVSWQCWNSEI